MQVLVSRTIQASVVVGTNMSAEARTMIFGLYMSEI